jgi:hypothetical protein
MMGYPSGGYGQMPGSSYQPGNNRIMDLLMSGQFR